MERLPKRLEEYLLLIAPHTGELDYLRDRIESLSPDAAWYEMGLLISLEERGLIECIGDRVTVRKGPGGADHDLERELRLRTGYALTADGTCYLDGLRKARLYSALRVISEVTTFVGGVAAIVNLVLYIIWR